MILEKGKKGGKKDEEKSNVSSKCKINHWIQQERRWLGEECYGILHSAHRGLSRMLRLASFFTQRWAGIPRTFTRVYTAPECAPICGFRHPDKSANGAYRLSSRALQNTPGCCNAPSSLSLVMPLPGLRAPQLSGQTRAWTRARASARLCYATRVLCCCIVAACGRANSRR